MIVEEIYKCEYCGEIFDDEEECVYHEWNKHRLTNFFGKVEFYNWKSEPIPVKAESNLDYLYYVVITDARDIPMINALFEEQGNLCLPYENDSQLFWWDEDSGNWNSLTEEEKKLMNLREKFLK